MIEVNTNPAAAGMTSAVLPVPGARLYYERRGAGPLLALIPAGAGDADSYGVLAGLLASQYSVVTYDRRGYSRSPLDDPDQSISIATHRDDLQRLLAALAAGPAAVLGCSIGAIIGLDLAIHHPQQVRVLVAHEPPLASLLPEAEQAEAQREQQAVMARRREAGSAAALTALAANLGVRHAGAQPGRRPDGPAAPLANDNPSTFFKYDAGAVARYVLDLPALQAAPTRIVVAGGRDGRAFMPYRAAAALAARLGQPLVEFPGNHAGFAAHPREFAARLSQVIES